MKNASGIVINDFPSIGVTSKMMSRIRKHLPTGIILTMMTSAMFWANMAPHSVASMVGDTHTKYDWPVDFMYTFHYNRAHWNTRLKYYQDVHVIDPGDPGVIVPKAPYDYTTYYFAGIFVDVVINLALILGIGFACEKVITRDD